MVARRRHLYLVWLLIVAVGVGLVRVGPVVADPPAQSDKTESGKAPNLRRTQQGFRSLQDALDYADEELLADVHPIKAALVYKLNTPDSELVVARTQLHFVGRRAGYIPGKASTAEFMVQTILVHGPTQAVELHVIAPGFEEFVERTILRAGEMMIWDDIVLTPIGRRSAASVVGRVQLEDGTESLEGLVIYVDEEAVAFTDSSGRFVADGLRSGELHISTSKPGYVGLHTQVTVSPGRRQSCELLGYRVRYAHVEWAFQPDGTRRFDAGVQTGTAVLSSWQRHRVSFSKGFEQVPKHSDFLVFQVKDELRFRHFDATGHEFPASRRIKDINLATLVELPETGYQKSTTFSLHPGDVFAFNCHDGKHYGVMEVLDITVEPPGPD